MQKNIFYPKNAIRLCLANQKQEHFDGILYSCVRKEGFAVTMIFCSPSAGERVKPPFSSSMTFVPFTAAKMCIRDSISSAHANGA